MQRLVFSFLFLTCAWTAPSVAAGEQLSAIDDAVKAAIERKALPGAVVLVLHKDNVLYRKSFGRRVRNPAPTLMTDDTVFDLASLTKPIATATAIMLLIQD